MAVIPNNQDVATFLGGTFSQPQLVANQIPGANYSSNPVGQTYDPMHQQYMQSMQGYMQGPPPPNMNSGYNHAVGGGAWYNALKQGPNMGRMVSSLAPAFQSRFGVTPNQPMRSWSNPRGMIPPNLMAYNG